MVIDDTTLEHRMSLAQRGDKRVYSIVLGEIANIVRNHLRKSVYHSDDLEDVVQESLMSIHRAIKTYDPKRPIKPWIMAIATYRLNDYLRKKYRRAAREVVDYDTVENFLSDDVTEPSDFSEILGKALDSLPHKQRKIVTMMKIEGHSVRDVAKHMGMNASAVKTSAHRAYKKLRVIMENE